MEVAWTRVAAYALCTDDGRILLTRFALSGHPDHGRWTMPGGGMEWGESPLETAHRELLEETGLAAALGEVAGVYARWLTAEESVRGESGLYVAIVFHASDVRGDLLEHFDADDTTDAAQWFPIEGLDEVPHVELVDFVLELLASRGD
jgi:ADP-ribose pyrophosphatase YjhB (NUDIX family)